MKAGLMLGGIVLAAVLVSEAVTGTGPAATNATSGLQLESASGPLHATECQVKPARPHGARHLPLLVAVGASFTAGVGVPRAEDNWALHVAELLGWRARTIGVPGAGYTTRGLDDLGPLRRELRAIHVRSLHPAAVVIQAGHDDWQVPARTERRNVERLVRLLESDDPHSRLVFLTVFAPPGKVSHRLHRINHTIISSIERADPRALVIDPIEWRFRREHHSLHPSEKGSLHLAKLIARRLVEDHVAGHSRARFYAPEASCKVL